jgi:hypothetical protein
MLPQLGRLNCDAEPFDQKGHWEVQICRNRNRQNRGGQWTLELSRTAAFSSTDATYSIDSGSFRSSRHRFEVEA